VSAYHCDMEGNELSSEIKIDTRRESYANFFDNAWADSFLKAASETRLGQASLDLCISWKGSAVVCRMPWLMIDSLRGFHAGYTRGTRGYQPILAAVAKIVTLRVSLSETQRREVTQTIEGLSGQIEQELAAVSPLDPDEIWRGYLKIPEFALSLWASMRKAYGSLYYAYENYLRAVVGAARNDDDYKAYKTSQLKEDFAAHCGDPLAVDCIDHPRIVIAREVRNSLTHNGGRLSPKLAAKPHGILVYDNRFQIFPDDVRALFALLQERALKVANAAKGIAVFRLPTP
jgi:hypothetical protein